MNPQKPTVGPQPVPQSTEGCLAVAIRVPVRIVVLVLVLPVRLAWDGLVVAGRFLNDTVLRPAGRALLWLGRAVFARPFVGLWRYVAVPVGHGLGRLGHVLLVVPWGLLYRHALTPIGHAIGWAARGIGAGLARFAHGTGAALAWVHARVLTPIGHGTAWLLTGVAAVLAVIGTGVYAAGARLARHLVVVPAVWLYAWVLAPVGRGIARCAKGLVRVLAAIGTGIGAVLYWTARILLVLPAQALWRFVLVPLGRGLAVVGRETGAALGHAWRVAGHISRTVGRFLATLFRWIFVDPARWTYRTVLTPVGHVVRDTVLRPAAEAARGVGRATRQALASARESVRQARADFRRMILGDPRQPSPVARREPAGADTRTLGSSRTALTKD
ncbi:membrane protein [Streptomyces sp. AS58]|uniref:hypothetical protein n=1 Tax=Streptomyces sp. AS58 TaxID=1519489 RepID=UPI0006ADC756|nr:hypothetical protein [Streptomyces sp. AS58]KOV55853.1 membrane protein [Streptomyces sp. AS58]